MEPERARRMRSVGGSESNVLRVRVVGKLGVEGDSQDVRIVVIAHIAVIYHIVSIQLLLQNTRYIITTTNSWYRVRVLQTRQL